MRDQKPLIIHHHSRVDSFDSLQVEGGVTIKAWTHGVPVEKAAIEQTSLVATLPFVGPFVALMPDVHSGIGATVGSVIPTRGAIIPAAVGVDIGCGMIGVRTSLSATDLPDSLAAIRAEIESMVPHGRSDNGGSADKGAWHVDPPASVSDWWSKIGGRRLADIEGRHPKAISKNADRHLGTLGTGNHFIEVCLDEKDRVWVVLHSGSRGLGNRFGTYFIEKAREEAEKWFINLPNKDLAYFPEGTEFFSDYMNAVSLAQDFAMTSRTIMMDQTLLAIGKHLPPFGVTSEAVNCHHNYVARETINKDTVWVTRKGAIRARLGDMGIIPGSMGARTYIVRGKGNPDSLMSCSHGAGRAMSRTEARKRFTVEDHIKATAGVECRKDADVVDETPAAYKSIDAVMAAQTDLVDVVHVLRQVICVKG